MKTRMMTIVMMIVMWDEMKITEGHTHDEPSIDQH